MSAFEYIYCTTWGKNHPEHTWIQCVNKLWIETLFTKVADAVFTAPFLAFFINLNQLNSKLFSLVLKATSAKIIGFPSQDGK